MGLKDFVAHLNPRVENKLVNLVGRKCVARCLNGRVTSDVLWDTGAQISLVSEQWLKANQTSNYNIGSLENLLEKKQCVEAVGGHAIPYKGVSTLPVKLNSSDVEVEVPFLVTQDDILQQILGFNVIETLVNKGVDNKALYTCFSGVSVDRIESMVNLLQADTNPTLSKFSILKQGMSIKSGEIAKVLVKINVVLGEYQTPVLFEPRLEHAFENITICSNIIFLKESHQEHT